MVSPTNWWYFEEDGDALDGSANHDDLTRNGSVSRSSTHKQGSFSASFAGGYYDRAWASLSSNFILKNSTTAFSLGCWAQIAANDQERSLVTFMDGGNNYDGIEIKYLSSTGKFQFAFDIGGVFYTADPPATASLNTWYHLCAVWDGDTVTFYQDGSAGTPTTVGATAPSWAGTPFIVGAWNGNLKPWSGLIDELFIYRNTALSSSDITSIINNGLFPTVITLTPSGFGLSPAVGGAPVAVPAGLSTAPQLGTHPAIVVPAGFAATTAIGTPTLTLTQNPAGIAVTPAFGTHPALAIPPGTSVTPTLGVAPIAVPKGFTAQAVFGTPTLGAAPITTTVSEIQHSGLGLARFTLERILAAQSELDDLRARTTAKIDRVQTKRRVALRSANLTSVRAATKPPKVRDVTNLTSARDATKHLDSMLAGLQTALDELDRREEILSRRALTLLSDETLAISATNRRALAAIENAYHTRLQEDDEEAILVLKQDEEAILALMRDEYGRQYSPKEHAEDPPHTRQRQRR